MRDEVLLLDSAIAVLSCAKDAKDEAPSAIENWLHNEIAPAYDAMKAGKLKMLSGNELRASLKAKQEQRGKVR